MSHPSACGVSADDVAVLVHDDLLAIGQGHGIAAIADIIGSDASLTARGLHDHIIFVQNCPELRIHIGHSFLLSLLPDAAGTVMEGVGLTQNRGTILGDPIGSDFQGTGAGEALLGDHEPGIAGSAKQAGGRVE